MSVMGFFLLTDMGVGTHASSEGEFEIVGHVCVVRDGVVDALVQQVLVAVEVLGNS